MHNESSIYYLLNYSEIADIVQATCIMCVQYVGVVCTSCMHELYAACKHRFPRIILTSTFPPPKTSPPSNHILLLLFHDVNCYNIKNGYTVLESG